jgi:hypothetical protein
MQHWFSAKAVKAAKGAKSEMQMVQMQTASRRGKSPWGGTLLLACERLCLNSDFGLSPEQDTPVRIVVNQKIQILFVLVTPGRLRQQIKMCERQSKAQNRHGTDLFKTHPDLPGNSRAEVCHHENVYVALSLFHTPFFIVFAKPNRIAECRVTTHVSLHPAAVGNGLVRPLLFFVCSRP